MKTGEKYVSKHTNPHKMLYNKGILQQTVQSVVLRGDPLVYGIL